MFNGIEYVSYHRLQVGVLVFARNLLFTILQVFMYHEWIFLFKVGLSPSKKVCVICFSENSLKMMKIAFCFILKALSYSRCLSFCDDVLVIQEKWLDQKDKVNWKKQDVTTWLANNCNTHIYQYSQYKYNQTIKLDQLIKYNKKNIFL